MVASAIAIALDPDVIFDEVHKQNPDLAARGVTDTMLEVATYVMAGGIVLWCVGAAAMAVLVYRAGRRGRGSCSSCRPRSRPRSA